METSTINYRVADFLKKYPPFHAMEEGDLIELAGRGHVKFFEANEYIVVQGSPYMFRMYVIQQGTITLWDEEGEIAQLKDVRGAGDFLGIEQFNGVDAYPHTARTSSDVVLYAFPAMDFESLVMKYDYARQYVAAYGTVNADYKSSEEQREPKDVFIQELVAGRPLQVCDAGVSIREAAQQMLASGSEAMAVVDSNQRVGVVTPTSFLEWIVNGQSDPADPVAGLVDREVPFAPSDASVADAAIALSASNAGALALTDDGTPLARLHAVVTPRDLQPVFGDQPSAILQEIRRASGIASLRDLNQRARAFVLRHLSSAGTVEWLTHFTSLVDEGIVKRLISLGGGDKLSACWCFSGPAGRGETLTRLQPELVVIAENDSDSALQLHRQVSEDLSNCGYIPPDSLPFEPAFYAASLGEWQERYEGWIRDPIIQNMYEARPLFDLRPVNGKHALFEKVDGVVRKNLNNDFLFLVANDCLESLPPLTFFQDAVISESGDQSDVFRLGYSALGPLVDVGRVFGMASGKIMGSSTLERFVMARTLLPDQSSIFREASDTLRVVLWQQGRVGICQNTSGSELPPALLSRYDRQVLKSAFRSILKLIEFTGNPQWLTTL